jgi:hypothetical protein
MITVGVIGLIPLLALPVLRREERVANVAGNVVHADKEETGA